MASRITIVAPIVRTAIWDDVESELVVDGKDNKNAWQPKSGSSPVHPLGDLQGAKARQKCPRAEKSNPESCVTLLIPMKNLHQIQYHYSHRVPRTGEQPRSGCFDMRKQKVR